MAILWSETMSTGIPALDRHHRHMIDIVNTLGERLTRVGEPIHRAELGSVLATLDVYAGDHFTFEEQCMSVLRCPSAVANCEAHRRFRESLTAFRARLVADDVAGALAVDIEAFLSRWLLEHICVVDATLIHCARKHTGN